jgi:hypothetical protein
MASKFVHVYDTLLHARIMRSIGIHNCVYTTISITEYRSYNTLTM